MFSAERKRKLVREIGERAKQAILNRTASGSFSRRSSQPRANRYADGTSPVTLRETGAMLNSLKGRAQFRGDKVQVEIEPTGTRNKKLAYIHNTEGTPSRTGRIRREFLYLNEGEWDRVVLEAMRATGLRKGQRGRRGDRF